MEYSELLNIQNEYDLKVKDLQNEFAVFVEKYKNEFSIKIGDKVKVTDKYYPDYVRIGIFSGFENSFYLHNFKLPVPLVHKIKKDGNVSKHKIDDFNFGGYIIEPLTE